MTFEHAIWMVRMGQAERIAAPGEWKVWREGETVRHEILPNSHDDPAFAECVKKASRAND